MVMVVVAITRDFGSSDRLEWVMVVSYELEEGIVAALDGCKRSWWLQGKR